MLPEPSVIIFLQVRGDAPLHRFAPAPQLQSVSCGNTYGFSHLLKSPPVQHLYGSDTKSPVNHICTCTDAEFNQKLLFTR